MTYKKLLILLFLCGCLQMVGYANTDYQLESAAMDSGGQAVQVDNPYWHTQPSVNSHIKKAKSIVSYMS
jgi:hypothetical protein